MFINTAAIAELTCCWLPAFNLCNRLLNQFEIPVGFACCYDPFNRALIGNLRLYLGKINRLLYWRQGSISTLLPSDCGATSSSTGRGLYTTGWSTCACEQPDARSDRDHVVTLTRGYAQALNETNLFPTDNVSIDIIELQRELLCKKPPSSALATWREMCNILRTTPSAPCKRFPFRVMLEGGH